MYALRNFLFSSNKLMYNYFLLPFYETGVLRNCIVTQGSWARKWQPMPSPQI